MQRPLLAALFLVVTEASAHATWSVVAVDPMTREVGVAGATCGELVWMIAGLVPGEGAVAAQGSTNPITKQRALRMLSQHALPSDVVASVTSSGADQDTGMRQYGVASLRGPAAAFSGDALDTFTGSFSSERFTIQGNTLVDPSVVDAARVAFENAYNQPLAERLLRALEAGSVKGGDSRCPVEDSARSAFLLVAAPDDNAQHPRIDLKVDKTIAGHGNPVHALRDLYSRHNRALGCSHVTPEGAAWCLVFLATWRRRAGRG
jgi:uncharacterized Ntn-hydrolase superfamily protein